MNTIQEDLLNLAKTATWKSRSEALYKKENELAKEYWVSVFSRQQFQEDPRVRRYLSLTSLPFQILDVEGEYDFADTQRSIASLVLKKLRKNVIVSTGNLLPIYFVIGSNVDPYNDYLRKALLVAEIYFECWFTQISEHLQEEIELLQPQYLIVLGSKAKEKLDSIAENNAIVVTEYEYMLKTKHPYSEYGEGIKTAIDFYKEKKNVTS